MTLMPGKRVPLYPPDVEESYGAAAYHPNNTRRVDYPREDEMSSDAIETFEVAVLIAATIIAGITTLCFCVTVALQLAESVNIAIAIWFKRRNQ